MSEPAFSRANAFPTIAGPERQLCHNTRVWRALLIKIWKDHCQLDVDCICLWEVWILRIKIAVWIESNHKYNYKKNLNFVYSHTPLPKTPCMQMEWHYICLWFENLIFTNINSLHNNFKQIVSLYTSLNADRYEEVYHSWYLQWCFVLYNRCLFKEMRLHWVSVSTWGYMTAVKHVVTTLTLYVVVITNVV